MSVKELYKKYKREIWVGVVVSLITSAIIKFGDWLLDVAPTVGTTISETLSNVLYSLAATYSDRHLFKIVMMSAFSIMVASISKSVFDALKLYKTVIRIEKESAKYTEDEKKEKYDKALSKDNSRANEDSVAKVKRHIHEGKKLGKGAVATVFLLILMYLYCSFSIIAPMSLSDKFSQDIVKIAPYIEECDMKKLQSDWVCMRSKADYDKIYETINGVKKTHNLPD